MTGKQVFDRDGGFVLVCSPGGKVLYSSPGLNRLMGRDMTAQHIYDHLSGDEISRLMEALQEDRVRMQCTLENRHFFLVAEKADQGIRMELFPLDPPADPFMEPVSGQFFCREMAGYLSAMLPAAQRLMEKVPEELKQEAAVVLRNGFCQMRLQRDLSDLLAMQNGQSKLFVSEEDAGALLNQLAEEVRPYCDALNIQLRCILPEQTVRCTLDKQRVRRMLYQLISNSIKSQPQGGQITLALKEREEEIGITVTDLGCGIPTEDLDTVFRKYTTGDPASGASLGGMGLGLPLARQIAQLHGGRLLIVSNENAGTSVSAILPKVPLGETMAMNLSTPSYTGGFDPAKLELSTVLGSRFYLK